MAYFHHGLQRARAAETPLLVCAGAAGRRAADLSDELSGGGHHAQHEEDHVHAVVGRHFPIPLRGGERAVYP